MKILTVGSIFFLISAAASAQGGRWVVPYLAFSTYLGGLNEDEIDLSSKAIAVDTQSNAWVIGYTSPSLPWDPWDFPLVNPLWPDIQGNAVLCEFSPAGELVMSTCIGGGGEGLDQAYGICALRDGGVAVTGITESRTLPVVNAYQASNAGYDDAFLIRIGPDGREIKFATYFGGSGFDEGMRVAEGPDGGIWLAGFSYSELPWINPVQEYGVHFLAEFSADGSSLRFCTPFGGGCLLGDLLGLAVAPDGTVYITGVALDGENFPFLNPFSEEYGIENTYIAGFAASGNPLLFSTLFGGGSGVIDPADLQICLDGSFWLSGRANYCTDFPYINPLHPPPERGNQDWYASHFTADGQTLLFSTTFGGSDYEFASTITNSTSGLVLISGYTNSRDYPLLNALDSIPGSFNDAFLTIFSEDGPELLCSTLFGGEYNDLALNIALAADCSVWAVGATKSSELPLVNPVFPALSGDYDLFVAHFFLPGIWNCGVAFSYSAQPIYAPGDRFFLETIVSNFDLTPHQVMEYIVLEVNGELFFWPSWSHIPNGNSSALQPNEEIRRTIVDFTWPTDAGAGHGIRFWGALVDPDTQLIAGRYDMYEFDYKE